MVTSFADLWRSRPRVARDPGSAAGRGSAQGVRGQAQPGSGDKIRFGAAAHAPRAHPVYGARCQRNQVPYTSKKGPTVNWNTWR